MDEVSRLVNQDIPSFVARDFNYVDGPQEKRDGRPFSDNIETREFIMRNGLIDLVFFRPRFI